MTTSASVSLAIRNPLTCEGLRRILSEAEFDIACTVDRLEALDESCASESPHLLVVDRPTMGADAASAVAEVLQRLPDFRVVILADKFLYAEMAAVYSAGAYAYFLSHAPYQSFIAMMQMVALGQKVAPTELIDMLNSMPIDTGRTQTPAARVFGLSERELVILNYLVRGLPNKAISRHLAISESAVKVAVKAILRKMSVQNRTQAAVLAHDMDLLSDTLPEDALHMLELDDGEDEPADEGGRGCSYPAG